MPFHRHTYTPRTDTAHKHTLKIHMKSTRKQNKKWNTETDQPKIEVNEKSKTTARTTQFDPTIIL